MRRNDFYDGHMNYGLGWLISLLLVGLLIAAITALVVYLINRAKDAPAPIGSGTDDGSSARRILDERLARGDIDPDEYRERRRALDA